MKLREFEFEFVYVGGKKQGEWKIGGKMAITVKKRKKHKYSLLDI